MNVVVVLDRSYGARSDPRLGPAFWLINSPENRALADRLWSRGDCDPNSAVFDGERWDTLENAALGTFYTVVDHHPAWRTIEFVGVQLTPELRAELTEQSGGSISANPASFVLARDD